MTYSFDDLYWERELRKCGKGAVTFEDQFSGFVYWCENYAYIEHPKGRRLLALRDAQLLTAWDFIAEDQVLILKARQIGFTTLCMAFAVWRALFFEDWSCINLSRRKEDAEDALGKAIFAYEHLPDGMKSRLPARLDSSTTRMRFTNASRIESHPSRNNPARGRTVSLIIVDEWAFFENPAEAWSSIKPTFDIGGRLIALSTANGSGNLFHEMWVGATTGSNNFKPVFFPWSAVPERDEAWYERQRQDMLPWILHQEFPRSPEEAFIKSGNPVFDVDKLDQIETAEPIRGYLAKHPYVNSFEFRPAVDGQLSIYEFPKANVTYVLGADVAEGLEYGDYSVAWIISTFSGKCVAKWRGHVDPDLFGSAVLANLGYWYNTALCGVEVNNHGYATCAALANAHYPNIYFRTAYDDRTMRPTSKIGWRSQINTKPLMIDNLRKALREEIQLRDAETIAELKTFVADPDGKMHGSPFDDQVIALGIANMMRQHAATTLVAPQRSTYMTAGAALKDVLDSAQRSPSRVGRFNERDLNVTLRA